MVMNLIKRLPSGDGIFVAAILIKLMAQCLAKKQEYACIAPVEASVDAALPIDSKYRHVR